MTRALLRSMASATAALAVVGLGELTYFAALCRAHKAWVRTSLTPDCLLMSTGTSWLIASSGAMPKGSLTEGMT